MSWSLGNDSICLLASHENVLGVLPFCCIVVSVIGVILIWNYSTGSCRHRDQISLEANEIFSSSH